MNDDQLMLVCYSVGWFLSGMIGLAIGASRDRAAFGCAMGLVLGPLGWLVVLALGKSGPKCPFCLSTMNRGASHCCNCGSQIPVRTIPSVRG